MTSHPHSLVSRRAHLLTFTLPLLLLCLLLPSPAAGWWSKGHMAVAEVARRHLTDETLAKAERAAAVLARKGPYPLSADFVQSASWPDDIIRAGLGSMASWHYVTAPYIPAEEADTFNLKMSPIAEVNVMTIIPMLHDAIRSPNARADIISTSVANLLHYVGDVHQPLHTTNLFSTLYPTSDLGGNRIIVTWDPATGETMNLHAFWDSMGRGPTADQDVTRPLTKSGYAAIRDLVDYLEATYAANLTEAEKMELNSTVYVVESNRLAVDVVYKDVVNGTVLTDEYKARAREICDRRVLLAGYRLAAHLNSALAGVSLSTINAAEDAVAAALAADAANGDGADGIRVSGGLSGGQTAGLAVGLFFTGLLLAVLAVCVIFCAMGPAAGAHGKGHPRGAKEVEDGSTP